jgi:hypothetical protein
MSDRSLTEVSMKLVLSLSLVVALSFPSFVRAQEPAPVAKTGTPAAAKEKAPVYDEKAVGSEQIAAALARAKRENRRVLVQWGGNWCHWCVLLSEFEKSNAKVSKEILYEYDVVKIDSAPLTTRSTPIWSRSTAPTSRMACRT